jgi:hypothetical protein
VVYPQAPWVDSGRVAEGSCREFWRGGDPPPGLAGLPKRS